MPFFWEKLVNLGLPSMLPYLPLCLFFVHKIDFCCSEPVSGPHVLIKQTKSLSSLSGHMTDFYGGRFKILVCTHLSDFSTGIKCTKLAEFNRLLCNSASAGFPIGD